MEFAIRAEALSKHFGDTTALDGLDLEVRPGTVVGLLGPNGAGKTTAVRVLATLTTPDGGRATVGGHDVVRDAHEVRSRIGLTGQYAAVDEGLTGQENLMMIGRLLAMSRSRARTRATELLRDFELTDAGGRPAQTYSGGMRRRLDLAASMVARPEVLFLDEPTTGLDPRSRMALWDFVRELARDGVTVLLTTQYLEEADALADRITVVDHGRNIADGTPAELKARVGGQFLTVRPTDEADTAALVAAVGAITGHDVLVDSGVVTTAVTRPDVLGEVVSRLEAERLGVAELSLRTSSLDEVFLALTGRSAGEPSTETSEETAA